MKDYESIIPFISYPVQMVTYALNQIQNLLSSIQGRGQDCVKKAHRPVRWHHNTHTYLRRVHCDGQGRHKQHKGYQTKCHRSYIYFPCVPRWCENVTAHYLTEPNQKLPRRRVVYPLAAENVSGPLLTRLRGVNQPVIHT